MQRGGGEPFCTGCSKSGWFDSISFEDWFELTFLPNVRNLDGPKVIIGDNLSSHISLKVLKSCEDNNVRFICLPPNSTHLTQPLDVAFFAPLKRIWHGKSPIQDLSLHLYLKIPFQAY